MRIKPNLKAYVAALGGTVTAVTTFLATLSLVVGDDAITMEEVSSVASAVVSLVGTVLSVWKVTNEPVN